MDYDSMTVTMEAGWKFVFFYEDDEEDDEDSTLKFVMCNGSCFHENEVREGSIHAVVGEPLSFTYYYGYGSSDDIKTETLVKEIECE